jgi:hypothetical protein
MYSELEYNNSEWHENSFLYVIRIRNFANASVYLYVLWERKTGLKHNEVIAQDNSSSVCVRTFSGSFAVLIFRIE